jgi:hypothetical protein
MQWPNDVLVARALNAVRPLYFPSYVGVRLLASHVERDDDYLARLIVRRLNSLEHWRYTKFQLYKGSVARPDAISHEYRDAVAPSAITAVAEAVVLGLIANDAAFAVPSRVYSYRWPRSSKSGGSYEYFAIGYVQRNEAIAAALSHGKIAVITDIKSFYPSARPKAVLALLEQRLRARVIDSVSPLSILGFFEQLMGQANGIPIGPSAGHVLGHLVLEPVDKELTSKFGDQYFRYVDDIIVVTDAKEASKTTQIIEASLEGRGFELNASKTVLLEPHDWRQLLLYPDVAIDDSFRAFSSDLVTFLAFRPGEADRLKDLCVDNGLSVPVSRLLSLSKYPRFRHFLKRRHSWGALQRSLRLMLTDARELLARALRLKVAYESSLRQLLAGDTPTPELRRWKLQRIRRVVNTLFYLRSFSEWNEGTKQLSDYPELVEQRALARALTSGVANSVLPFYNRGPASFAELWGDYGNGLATLHSAPFGFTSHELDSLVFLHLHGTLRLDDGLISSAAAQSRMTRAAFAGKLTARTAPDMSFEDEFESLRLNVTPTELARLARTRYSYLEGTALDALTLMSSEYRS